MNITITGNLGSGKSSICKALASMGYQIISVGTLFRQLAAEHNMTVNEFNKYAETVNVDQMLDDRTVQIGSEVDNAVFDSRLAWNFLPDSFKVFVLVSPDVAADRVYNDDKRVAETYNSKEEALASLLQRTQLENERYAKIYGINYNNLQNYNLVIESSYATPDQIAQEIIRNFELYQQGAFRRKVELNLRGLYPTKALCDIKGEGIEALITADKENDTLCAAQPVTVGQARGYNCILDGHGRVLAAIQNGKAFFETDGFAAMESSRLVSDPAELSSFEEMGGFSYDVYPDQASEKQGYINDLSLH